MQAAYHPQEPVAHVEEEVAALLGGALRGRPFYLFTTPPRTGLAYNERHPGTLW